MRNPFAEPPLRLALVASAGIALSAWIFAENSYAGAGSTNLPAGIVQTGSEYLSTKDGMPLVMVPGGEFMMGYAGGCYDECPPHKVRLDPYFIDKHEVTNGQFERFIKATGYHAQGPWRRGYGKMQADYPCRFVTWYDAKAYAAWAGRELPSEAQWEFAARGAKSLAYPWGEQWKDGLCRSGLDVAAGPIKIGSYPRGASPCGCLDMAGNVWEWVNDWYDRYYYQSFKAVATNPTGPPDGAQPEERFVKSKTAAGNERSTLKVIRGGAWAANHDDVRGARRMWGNPSYWLNDTGFRLALPMEKKR